MNFLDDLRDLAERRLASTSLDEIQLFLPELYWHSLSDKQKEEARQWAQCFGFTIQISQPLPLGSEPSGVVTKFW